MCPLALLLLLLAIWWETLTEHIDSRALAVNGYRHAFSQADAEVFLSVVFCFCPQLITGVREGMTSEGVWDYLRALQCANDS